MRNDDARAWWWPDGAPSELPTSETELVSAAILCAALAETKASASASAGHNEAAARELEACVRQSPLPHSLVLPVLEFTADYVLAESASALICAVRATKPTDIFDAVVSSAVPLKKPTDRRFGGACIHAPFWKRAVRLNVEELYNRAQSASKPLFLCGHSIGGSIATLALCQLVYQHLPIATRLFLERKDTKRSTDIEKKLSFPQWLQLRAGPTEQQAVAESIPQVIAVGFGAPYCGCQELGAFLDALTLRNRVVTFVNELDCIPGVLNVAQSVALLTNTADRLQTIAKATALLLNLLPAGMQQQFLQLSVTAGSAAVPSAASAYLSMSLTILQKSFDKLREMKVIKGIDYEYAPCGTYIFMTKGGLSFELHAEIEAIRTALKEEEDDNSLTGNSVMQHFMREYVSAIARRSQSIQINETMNYYERLGVARNATPQQIRSSYKALALKWHPDKWANATVSPDERETAEGVFKLLAESYEVLSNMEARRAYDVHLDKPPSLCEEFMGAGTVHGKSLDEAIGTFRDVIDNLSAVGNRITSHFSSSSSTVVGHPLQHNGAPPMGTTSHSVAPGSHNCGGLTVNNHSNMFAPDRIRVARPVSTGTDGHDHIMYLKPDEVLPTDIPAPQTLSASATPPTSTASSTSSSTVAPASGGSTTSSAMTKSSGLKTISVVGGAVAVAVSVAIIVSAWSQFTDVSRKKRQSSVVRQMPAECLVLLLEDHRSAQNSMSAQSLLEEAGKHKKEQRKNEKKRASSTNGEDATSDDAVVAADSGNDFQRALAFRAEVQKQEDALIEQFFECRVDHEKASVEALVEEQFYDCIELDSEVSLLFGSVTAEEEEKKPLGDATVEEFPVGSTVNTPFGLGVIEVWGASRSAATVRFPSKGDALHCISRNDISRGASHALIELSAELETRRLVLADRVITNYRLDDAPRKRDTIKTLAVVGADGAIDTGIRAAGGVALANGMTRTTSAMGGMVAAPLTVASILVDIGKEYYDYRKKFSERKSLGVLSATSERLMRREFRLKTGEVVVSRTAAAAGAGLSAYGVASAMGVWAAAGVATGPIGIAAATSAAIIGGLIGFFGGSKVYSLSTKSYFTSHRHAKEHIDRLELGARILFEEFDPTGTGEITKEECLIIMTKLYEASGGISDKGYKTTVAALTDPKFEGPVTWRMFWLWVSTEASRALRTLDSKDGGDSGSDSESSPSRSPPSPSARERKRDLLRKFVADAKHKRVDIKAFGHEFMAAAKAEKEMKKQRKLLKRKAGKEASASSSSPPSPSSTSDPGSPASIASDSSEKLSDALRQLELLEQNEILSADQAQHLRDDLQSDEVERLVAATEIIGALAADKDGEPEAEYEIIKAADVDGKTGVESNESIGLVVPVAVRPVAAAESDGALVVLPAEAVTTTSSLKKPTATATLVPSRKAGAQVDERLDVLCSLLSAQGIERLLAMQNIVPEEKEAASPPSHEELHLLALATAATPSTITI